MVVIVVPLNVTVSEAVYVIWTVPASVPNVPVTTSWRHPPEIFAVAADAGACEVPASPHA